MKLSGAAEADSVTFLSSQANLAIHRRASGRRKERRERMRGTEGRGEGGGGESSFPPSGKCFQKVAPPQIQRSNKFFTAPEHLQNL